MLYTTHLLHHIRRVIGCNLHAARMERKISLGKLSAITGISRDTLDYYEIGKSQLCFEHIVQIACALDIEPSALLGKNIVCT